MNFPGNGFKTVETLGFSGKGAPGGGAQTPPKKPFCGLARPGGGGGGTFWGWFGCWGGCGRALFWGVWLWGGAPFLACPGACFWGAFLQIGGGGFGAGILPNTGW